MQPFITIGIASYNYSDCLDRAFNAIKNQTFRDFEIIYSDDGSTDASVDKINSYIKDNPDMNIRLITGRAGGVMKNKQRILDNAQGTYIMLCDADDWMDYNCLEVLANAAKKTCADRVVTEIRNVDKNGNCLHIQKLTAKTNKWCNHLHHGAIYKRTVISDNHITIPDRKPDDYCFIIQFNAYAKNTIFINKSVYNWCIHETSESRSDMTWQEMSGYYQAIDEIKQNHSLTEEDMYYIELDLLKTYYFNLIKYGYSYNNGKYVSAYHDIHSKQKAHNPDYLRNPYVKLRKSPYTTSVKWAIWGCCKLEKISLFRLALNIIHRLRLNKRLDTH